MGAAAPVRKPSPRRAPVRKAPVRKAPAPKQPIRKAAAQPARRRRVHPVTPPGGHLIPLAVGRTGRAVRDLPDSGMVRRLTRGRAWIAVLSVMLTGIVALNVVSLSISASAGKISQQTAALQEQNSALRAQIAQKLTNSRVQEAAASGGMASPAASDIHYRDASAANVAIAAARFGGGASGG